MPDESQLSLTGLSSPNACPSNFGATTATIPRLAAYLKGCASRPCATGTFRNSLIMRLALALGTLYLLGQSHAFDVLRDYSGQNFFEGWDFYGYWDNLTLGASASNNALIHFSSTLYLFQATYGG